ncbi:MAG: uroporphyrinogen-III C-methyltransferase [Cyclobacteriaceae bacterium]
MSIDRKKQPRLTLVGAGPGDPELITIKGINALATADVVLYDALAHPDLLVHAKKEIEKIYVGKLVGKCQLKQEDINQLIVDKALERGHVVRLKGGDPFVFGRGHEELVFAEKHGLETAIVPGLSSIYSVPELCGIPLTRRGINESFWVVTGTTKDHKVSSDIDLIAQSNATAVILMGMHKLDQIVAKFKNVGKNDTPVVIIQNGARKDQKVGVGTVSTIEKVVKESGLSAPAVIVIGEVARLYDPKRIANIELRE